MYDGFVNIISLVLLIDSARGLWGQHKFFKRTKTKVTNCDQIDDDLLDATLNLMDTTGKHSKIFLGILVALFFLQLCMKDWGGMKRITTVMTFVSIVFALTVSRRSNRIVKQIRESE